MRVPPLGSGLRGANAERPHQALGYCSPRQYQQQLYGFPTSAPQRGSFIVYSMNDVPQYVEAGKLMEHLRFAPLVHPTRDIAQAFTRWENDPLLIPVARPNRNQDDLDKRQAVTVDTLVQRLHQAQAI